MRVNCLRVAGLNSFRRSASHFSTCVVSRQYTALAMRVCLTSCIMAAAVSPSVEVVNTRCRKVEL